MRVIKGQLHRISSDYRLFSVQIRNRLEFFYLQPRFVKQFRKYLYPGVFIQFTVSEEKMKYRRRVTSKVLSFEQILGNRYNRSFSFFDQRMVKQRILEKMGRYTYRLFLDLEMTMQYSKSQSDEIIQVGAILVDQANQVHFTFDRYVQPTRITYISSRTLEFLNVRPSVIKSGITYREFYTTLKQVIDAYKPAIIVWGNNDNVALENSYIINRVSPLFPFENYINLQQVLKQYYNVNYELGLFQTAEIFGIPVEKQEHHAYEDASILQKIFNRFYEITTQNLEFNFKERLLKLI